MPEEVGAVAGGGSAAAGKPLREQRFVPAGMQRERTMVQASGRALRRAGTWAAAARPVGTEQDLLRKSLSTATAEAPETALDGFGRSFLRHAAVPVRKIREGRSG